MLLLVILIMARSKYITFQNVFIDQVYYIVYMDYFPTNCTDLGVNYFTRLNSRYYIIFAFV
jgi:hypothetical protein